MSDKQTPLDRLAAAHGIQLRYLSEGKEWRAPSMESKRAVLTAMGIDAGSDAQIAAALRRAPAPPPSNGALPAGLRCFMPSWLDKRKCWGVTCQLYGLRSARNHGIGDFEDLARLAEQAAVDGADMLGVNPLHALFTADPARCSPFSPSSRRFLNPLYIALDRIPGVTVEPVVEAKSCARLRAARRIDYPAVAALKLGALRTLWRDVNRKERLWHAEGRAAFDRFVTAGGTALHSHATFEALSHRMVAEGHGPGWQSWPQAWQDSSGAKVQRFGRDHDDDIRFHLWLQWIADAQLGAAAARACSAGMRIGLYLDLAVGSAPDGSDTWTDPTLIVPGAHIGAPPDSFFEGGQDWGLAPMSPVTLRARGFAPYRQVLESATRHAGAIRIDHAMSLTRLFWIPSGHPAVDGCYVQYPMTELVRDVVEVSQDRNALVIGEDLGTVPDGFSATMRQAAMMSCRVLFFEQTRNGFRAAGSYPRNALLSASTHDLPPLALWWAGEDIDLFLSLGMFDAAGAGQRRKDRAADRRALVARLQIEARRKVFAARTPDVRAASSKALTPSLAAAIHGYLARTPSRILAVQFEDLCGAIAPVNVPGTHLEYPNWQLRAPATLEDAPDGPVWGAIVNAVARERPRPA